MREARQKSMCMSPFTCYSRMCQLMHSDRKKMGGFLDPGAGVRTDCKEQEESHRSDGNVLYPDSAGDFTGVYNCQNSSRWAL